MRQYQTLLRFLVEEEHIERSAAIRQAHGLTRQRHRVCVRWASPMTTSINSCESTLTVNSFFQAVILKPYGYSPTIDPRMPVTSRRIDGGSRMRRVRSGFRTWKWLTAFAGDYDNLVRWQNVLNKRVKGATFDFLTDGDRRPTGQRNARRGIVEASREADEGATNSTASLRHAVLRRVEHAKRAAKVATWLRSSAMTSACSIVSTRTRTARSSRRSAR